MFAAGSQTIIVATIPPYTSTSNAGYSTQQMQTIIDTNVLIRDYVSANPDLILWEVHDTLDQDGDGFTDPQFRVNDGDIHPNPVGSQATAGVLIDIVNQNFNC